MQPQDMGAGSLGGLSPKGVDFSNETQALNFLLAILDDDELKMIGNAHATYFWYGVVVVVALATLANVFRVLTLRVRLRAAAHNCDAPTRPKNRLMRWCATITALARESTYLQFTPKQRCLWFRVPPLGTIMLVLTHFCFVIALEFINNDVEGAQFWQARGVRAGWLAIAQLPLLIILVGKYNIISLLSGVSYERINVLHRWTARIMLFMAILHFGYESYGWAQFGLVKLEWRTDTCPPTGIAALSLLLWLNLSTLAPFRALCYEFFVVQHLITFFGFIIAVMYHLPSTALHSRVYIYIPIAIWLADRLIQAAIQLYRSLNTCSATLTALDGDATRVRITNKSMKSWPSGSFVLLSLPQFGWIQSHPATILSTPHSHNGDLIFILKCRKGFTKRLMLGANTSQTALLPHTKEESKLEQNLPVRTYRAFIHGPLGGSHSDFGAFDSVALVAGSTGVTFTLSILQHLADRVAAGTKLPARRIHFVWCVRSSSWTRWCRQEISSAFQKLRAAGIEVAISIYVTCADAFTDLSDNIKEDGCGCDKSLGPCCCVVVDEDEESVTMRDDALRSIPIAQTEKDEAATRRLSATTIPPIHLQVLRCASFYSGRPDVRAIFTQLLEGADGESAIGVCGPIALNATVRNTVVSLSDERAIHKGSGAQGCYLHVESFS